MWKPGNGFISNILYHACFGLADYLFVQRFLFIYLYFLQSVCLLLRIIIDCLQWISTHTRVMLICAISIPKGWAHTSYTVHIACLLIMDSLGLYIWITIGRFIFLLKMNFLLRNSLTKIFWLLSLSLRHS